MRPASLAALAAAGMAIASDVMPDRRRYVAPPRSRLEKKRRAEANARRGFALASKRRNRRRS